MRWFTISLALLALTIVNTSAYPRIRRDAELQENENLSPLSENPSDNEEDRDKRALEAASQSKWGVKNAILGFVFGGQGQKSALTSASHLSQSPLSSSSPSLRVSSSSKVGSSKGATPRPSPSSTTEDIPVFDRNRVSLDFPGNLFGPSVSLLIKSTKIVGSVIQNSAERYQSFLRLFRPLFRGAFEIKGLDPATTKRPSTTTKEPVATISVSTALNNEIRRR